MTAFTVKGIFALILISHYTHITSWAKCVIDVSKDYNENSPMFLRQDTQDVVYPERSSPTHLTFAAGQEALLDCAGQQITRLGVSIGTTSQVVKCVDGLTFSNPRANDEVYSFKDLGCSRHPEPVTRVDERKKCPNGQIVRIGYVFSRSLFKPTIDLCHDAGTMSTRWSHSRISGSIYGNRGIKFRAPNFSKGSHYSGVSMSKVYPQSSQKETFMKIFGDAKSVDYYLPAEGAKKNYFVKGHLVARADLFFPQEQRSTYFYVNAVPMWQSINNGNWKSVESTVRRTASDLGDLDVWTGALGVLRLDGRDIHLVHDESRRLIPAPKLLFKLVYSATEDRALVFVTANNPHLEAAGIPDDYRICAEFDGCREFRQFANAFAGYTYCCRVGEFLQNPAVGDLGIPVDFVKTKPLTLS